MASFMYLAAMGALVAICSANPTAVGCRSFVGTISTISPTERASLAVSSFPIKSMFVAVPIPASRGSRCVAPSHGTMPLLESGNPNEALLVAIRMSHEVVGQSQDQSGPHYHYFVALGKELDHWDSMLDLRRYTF